MQTPNTLFSQRGATLTEAVIATLVISVGVLGLLQAQITALQGTHSAGLHTQAVLLARDMADRMRLNRTATLKGEYLMAATSSEPCQFAPLSPNSTPQQDQQEWLNQLSCLLSTQAKGRISASGARDFLIEIEWIEPPFRQNASPTQQRVATELHL